MPVPRQSAPAAGNRGSARNSALAQGFPNL